MVSKTTMSAGLRVSLCSSSSLHNGSQPRIILSLYILVCRSSRRAAHGQERGSLHQANHGKNLIVTRRGAATSESYRISLPHKKHRTVWDCGSWTAPRFPVVSIGDVNPPFWIFSTSCDPTIGFAQPARNLSVGTCFVEFTANEGSRLEAKW